MTVRYYTLLLAALIAWPAQLFAQQADTTASNNYQAERRIIESTLGAVVKVIKTATFRDGDTPVDNRLQDLATRLNAVNMALPVAPLSANAPADTPPPSISDLQQLENMLNELYDQVRDLRTTFQAENNYELANRLIPVETGIDEAVVQTRRIIKADEALMVADLQVDEDRQGERWLKPGRYRDGERRSSGEVGSETDDAMDDVRDSMDDVRVTYREAMEDVRQGVTEARNAVHDADRYASNRKYYRYREPRSPFDDFDYADAYVGEFFNRWPYRETALYRPVPAIRYNRVEGLVLGARFLPLEWGDWESAKIYGQAGYAFEMKKPRYEVGLEVRPFPHVTDDFDFKLGASYRRNTTTNDLWKINWLENSLSAMLFEYDYMDYFEVQGFSVYAIQRLSPYAQFSLGYRSEDYSSLENKTTWSLFGGNEFRLNPFINEGRMNSAVFALEGGQLAGLHSVPRGTAFRFEAEVGQLETGSGNLNFSRYLGDMRFYIPFGYSSSFGMRFRGGFASEDTPIQKMFTLGGIGSIRAYPQNAFYGTRMVLANAEYTIANISPLDDIFDDIQLFGFAEAGWVNAFGNNTIDKDNIFPAAGFGLSFADRSIRLELAWPLKEYGGQKDPTLWLRLSPTF